MWSYALIALPVVAGIATIIALVMNRAEMARIKAVVNAAAHSMFGITMKKPRISQRVRA